MDTSVDPGDLLMSNVYIPVPENIDFGGNIDGNEEFKKYYKSQLKLRDEANIIAKINKIELKDVVYNESSEVNNVGTFNKNDNGQNNIKIKRSQRENIELISVDSRDRDKLIYLKPSNFKIFLDKTFLNVKQIKLVSLEFPNTDAVINSSNNVIYWRNKEDIDSDITQTTKGIVHYPVYSVNLRIGSYTASSLQAEITKKLNSVRRTQGIHINR
jgi:hypothetical protein